MDLHKINFWKRLEMFAKDVQVNDAMSEEEKEMIVRIAQDQQKLNIASVSGKRPCTCSEEITDQMIADFTEWAKSQKAACASGAVDTVAERWLKIVEQTIIEGNYDSRTGENLETISSDLKQFLRKSSEGQP